MFPVFIIFLAPGALVGCAVMANAAARARRASQPAWHLTLFAAAFALLCPALLVHAYGQMTMFYFMIDEQCSAHNAGEFIDFHQSFLPVSGLLECADRSIQLVPSWVNPTVVSLLTAAFVSTLAATAIRLRHRRLQLAS